MKKVLYFLALLMLASCANRVAPTGGEKDTTPPKLLEAIPAEKSLHFNAKEIRLKFDEYVTLSDLQSQLMISPLTSKQPVVKVGKKELIIEMPDSLQPNTTYTISFGKAVVDVHESNPIDDFKYVFSTGDYIDSLSLTGEIREAAGLTTSKGITVLVYRKTGTPDDDSLPLKSRPAYFSRTNDKGMFRISNMSAGTYYVYGLDDRNNNYFCDRPSEEAFGFYGQALKLPEDSVVSIKTSLEYPAKVRLLKSSKVDRGTMQVYFNRPDQDIQIRDFNNNAIAEERLWWSKFRDTVTVFEFTGQDSMNLLLVQNDSVFDSLMVKMAPDPGVKTELINRYKILSSPQEQGPQAPLVIQSFHPLKTNAAEVQLQEDSSKVISLPLQLTNPAKGILTLNYPWKEGANYNIVLNPGQLSDKFNARTDTARFSFRVPDEKSTAILTLKTEGLNPGSSYILQLVTEKQEVLNQVELNHDSTMTFKYLPANSIKIKVIHDINRDGHWTPGNFATHTQPEPVFIQSDKITLRANWELETIVKPEF